jgi:hypothetical protein
MRFIKDNPGFENIYPYGLIIVDRLRQAPFICKRYCYKFDICYRKKEYVYNIFYVYDVNG